MKDDDKKTKEFFKNIGIFIVAIFIIAMIYGAISDGFNFVSKKLDKRSSRKAYCAERIEHVKNEFTAKKIYKACMDR